METEKKHTCCFFGHGNVEATEKLRKKLNDMIEVLIVEEKVDTFLFGRKNEFDILCLCAVTKLKEKYPHIKRIYTRTDFPFLNGNFVDYDQNYDDVYYPGRILHDGKTVYKGRSKERLDMSDTCLLYDAEALRQGNAWFDFEYATQKGVCVINVGE